LKRTLTPIVLAIFVITARVPQAQSAADMPVLRGLAAASTLGDTDAGRAALAANYTVTGGIQTGAIRQATLLPFPVQQQQALQDAFSTIRNLTQLSDGLGTTLGAAYTARFHYTDAEHTSAMPETLGNLIHYATGISGPHSGLGKFLLANGTTEGKTPTSPDILKMLGGTTDVFGKAYNLPAGAAGGDKYGDARPFQTEKEFLHFTGTDYLNRPADNVVYNYGPMTRLLDSPSFPSGHTTYGFTGAVLLAVLVPERYGEMIVRGAEYGNDRILMGSHYAMDVLAGRTLALYDMAHLLSNDKAYMNQTVAGTTSISDFQKALKTARGALLPVLETGCGETVARCAKEDIGRFNNAAANNAFYSSTQTYGLPAVHPERASHVEDVQKIAPEAGYLLTQAFPQLTLLQADAILTETEGPGGGFLDDGSSFGVYSRLNLYAAARRAEQVAR